MRQNTREEVDSYLKRKKWSFGRESSKRDERRFGQEVW